MTKVTTSKDFPEFDVAGRSPHEATVQQAMQNLLYTLRTNDLLCTPRRGRRAFFYVPWLSRYLLDQYGIGPKTFLLALLRLYETQEIILHTLVDRARVLSAADRRECPSTDAPPRRLIVWVEHIAAHT
jgi:hypothetical protein